MEKRAVVEPGRTPEESNQKNVKTAQAAPQEEWATDKLAREHTQSRLNKAAEDKLGNRK